MTARNTNTSTVTTFVAYEPNSLTYYTRTSPTMNYTHAVLQGGYARSWHTSRELAEKARPAGARVVAVEAHPGYAAKVKKQLAAQHEAEAAKVLNAQTVADQMLAEAGYVKAPAKAPAKGRKAAAAKAPAPKAPATPAERAAATRAASRASTTTITCRVCGTVKPVNKFPTTGRSPITGAVKRGDRCRACRDAGRK